MTARIVQLTPSTPSALIKAQVQRERSRLEDNAGRNTHMSRRDTLINYADVLEQNAIYLAEMEEPDNQPVIDSLVGMTARIRRWLVD